MIKLKNILLEKKEFKKPFLDKLQFLTDRNDHTEARIYLSIMLQNKKLEKFYKAMNDLNGVFGGYGSELSKLNQKMEKVLYKEIQRRFANAKEIIGAL
jgi:F420-0:gamma-glutamyl ligase-like protein